MVLHANHIFLRALEDSDIDTLYTWENNTEIWEVSNTQTPYSRYVLEQYLQSSHQDIYTTKQLRLMICNSITGEPIGCIDLFDFEPHHQRAGIGILIANVAERQNNYATEALQILMNYCYSTLNLHQLYCNITTDNEASIKLFQKLGFEIIGTKKEWIRSGDIFKDELLLQHIRK